MKLRAGIPLRLLPGFQGARNPAEGLALLPGGDVRPGQVDWASRKRLPTAEEETAICEGGELPETRIGRFELPVHLYRKWQDSVGEPAQGASTNEQSFAAFMAATMRFLQFKEVPLPVRCQCDALAVLPSQGLLHFEGGGERSDRGECIVGINLGKGCAYIVYSNLPRARMVPDPAGPASEGAKSDGEEGYPLVCLRLEPREGVYFNRASDMDAIYISPGAEPGTILRIQTASP